MLKETEIIPAPAGFRESVIRLLDAEKLPFSDLPEILDHFWLMRSEGEIVGAIGMEPFGSCALLRSMVVKPAHRNKGIAGKLVEKLENESLKQGIRDIYLLTETAEKYFEHRGYRQIPRTDAPCEIQSSSEFSSVCPSGAALMHKRLQA